ncbi:MAG: UDP-N-acetylmuramoyl-L-alanyl-D-glutamate--2,6-diaminopimelate ligase [Actinobacteria bacterium]|nr:UDP-N-acetylmuramoyl-L-alanyl-D-glutamate--2,6-diaminopimelate ligase [Actinomycetota bacterium]
MSGLPPPKGLRELADATGDLLVEVRGDDATVVTDVAYDSRAVAPGTLFFCVPGARTDGHEFARVAVGAGAVALCVQRALDLDVPQIVVTDARRAMALISAAFFDQPAGRMRMFGITGTNGKTTTTYILEAILRAAGERTGLIGTIETRIGDRVRPGVRTTPESLDLQRTLWDMVSEGVQSVAMEVTSHALALARVEGIHYRAAAFTNLTQDHLDFHSGIDDYFEAKRSLFVPERTDVALVNVDDEYGRRLRASTTVADLGYGLSTEAEWRAEDIRYDQWGTQFVIGASPDELKISTSLVGTFNVYNCLAATACAFVADVPAGSIEAGVRDLKAVPGRFESIDEGQPFAVIVDYAHTPDSLDNVLREARRLADLSQGRVVCAFGCGGDRDRGKRPLMGAVVARLADVVIVTSDNPRSEDPDAIIAEILEGVMAERPDGPDASLVDRAEAIASGMRSARSGDVFVIAGKGHETGQQFADRTIPFDDREVARDLIRELGIGGRR